MFVNGKSLTKLQRSGLIAYCEQTDDHTATDTVREAVDFCALLRLDADMAQDYDEREEFVDEILRLLELDSVKGRPVSTLAQGELKRLTIGCELAANPSLLFLDEPTTGLDARSAAQVMRVLRNVSDTGRTVVCTIHQPSYDVFAAFDDLLLLAEGGRQVYSGPIGEHCSDLVRHLQEASPVVGKLPARLNPATWMLTELEAEKKRVKLLAGRASAEDDKSVGAAGGSESKVAAADSKSGGSAEEKRAAKAADDVDPESAAALALQARSPLLFEAFESSPAARAVKEAIQQEKRQAASGPIDAISAKQGAPRERVGEWARFTAVLRRTFAQAYRDTPFTGSRAITMVVLAVIFGLLFLDIDVHKDQGTVLSTVGVLQTAATFGGIIAMIQQVPQLYLTRSIFYRERASGLYSASSFFIALAVQEAVFLIPLVAAFGTIVYLLVDLRFDEPGVFLEALGALYVVSVWYGFMAQFFATAFPNAQIADIFVGVFLNSGESV